jgi:exonuclease SbcD
MWSAFRSCLPVYFDLSPRGMFAPALNSSQRGKDFARAALNRLERAVAFPVPGANIFKKPRKPYKVRPRAPWPGCRIQVIPLRFRFIHAADLHLDSPLLGLAKKSEDFAARIDDASRRAFDNLVALAIDEECRLVVIAGDVFDGQWRDYRTGQFFADRMRRLRERGIRVVMIAGNHDAENRFAGRLELSDNVTVLSAIRPDTVLLDELETAVHGQSFPQREVLDNMAEAYPRPVANRFNIGLLHTACSGRDGHANYAPCSVDQLANHGYQYWALGHIHAREELSTSPHIVFSGNLQGRSIREAGPKGATLVTVDDGAVIKIEHRSLDIVRWAAEELDCSAIKDHPELLERAYAAAEGRALALRLTLTGATALHADLATGAAELREETETVLTSIAGDIWLEKLAVKTSPLGEIASLDPTIAGDLYRTINDLADSQWLRDRLMERLADIRTKLPASAHAEALLAQLESEGPERARTFALALLRKGER